MSGGRFSPTTMRNVWDKAPTLPGRSPSLWRTDVNGREVFYPHRGLYGVTGWQVDHIVPPTLYRKMHGPDSDPNTEENGQILQSMANCRKQHHLLKSDQLKLFASHITLSPALMDFLEISAIGKIRDENDEDLYEILTVEEAADYFTRAKVVPKKPLPYFLPRVELEESLSNGLPLAAIGRAIKIFGINSTQETP